MFTLLFRAMTLRLASTFDIQRIYSIAVSIMLRYKGFPFMDRQWLSQTKGVYPWRRSGHCLRFKSCTTLFEVMMDPDRSVSLERVSKLAVIRFI